MSIGSVAVTVVPDSQNFWTDFRRRTAGQASEEGRRAGAEFRRGLDEANGRPIQIKAELDAARLRAQLAEATRGQSVRVGAHVDTARARTELAALNRDGSKSAGGLLKALLPLAPAVVPLAGAAAAAGAGLVGLGAAGLLAFGGLKNAIDEGTTAGVGLQTTFGGLKSDLAGLQSSAAAGLLPGVEASIATIKRETSTLGPVFKGEAALLGTALSSITTGLVGGFNSFAPVLNQVGVSIDHVAATFAAWATGPGGAKFANALSAEYAQVAPVLGEVASALGRVIGAGNATGLSIVSLIGDVATAINWFPTPALTAIVDGFVLFKAATLASAAFGAAKAGIATLGVAYSNVAAISQASSVARIAADEAAASVAADTAARSAAAMVLEAQTARASLLEIAAARGSNTASQQAQLDVQLAVADRQIAAYQAVATAAATSAAQQGAVAEGMAAASTRIGGAARSGLFGIVGGVAAAAIGIGLLVSQFHHSEDASRAAAVAAQAYTDALKGGGGADLVETITKGLTDANIGAKVREVNAALSDLGKGDFTASREFARSLKGVTVNAADFAGAIQKGGQPLAALRAQLSNIAAVSDATASKFERLAIAGQGDQRALQLKEQSYSKQAAAARALLKVLNDQVKAYHDGQKAELDYYAAIGKHVATVDQVAGSLHLASAQVKTYGEIAGIAFSKNGVAAESFAHVRAAVANVSAAFSTASATGAGFLSALQAFSTSAGTAADRATLIGATLKAANGDALAYAGALAGAYGANHQLVDSFRQQDQAIASARTALGQAEVGTVEYAAAQTQLQDALRQSEKAAINLRTGTIKYSREGAGPLVQQLQGIQSAAMAAAQATYQHARSTESGKRAADDAYKVYRAQTRGALMDEAAQLGLTSGQAKKLADKYFGMPKHVKTLIETEGSNPVVDVLNRIGRLLANLTGQRWDIKVATHYTQTGTPPRNLGSSGRAGSSRPVTAATGGHISGPGSGTSDSIPAWLSNGEYVVNAKATAKHRGLLEAINKGVQGFAAGGEITTGNTGGKTVWLYAGIRYSSLMAAENARTRAQAQAAAPTASFDRSSLSGFVQQATGTQPNALVGALASIFSAVASANKKLSDSFVSRLRSENRNLIGLTKERDEIANRLEVAQQRLADLQAKWRQEYATVKGAVTGSFNVAQAGQNQYGYRPTFGGILREARTAARNATRFAGILRKLRREGLNDTLLQQLAEAGPAALPQALALASATPKQILALNRQEQIINRAGTSAGHTVANEMYWAGIASADGLIRGLQHRESQLNAAVRQLAEGMVAQIRETLGIHSPSRVAIELGGHFGEGIAQGVTSKYARVADAADMLANGAAGVSQRGGSFQQRSAAASGNGRFEFHQHIHNPMTPTTGPSSPSAIRAAVTALG